MARSLVVEHACSPRPCDDCDVVLATNPIRESPERRSGTAPMATCTTRATIGPWLNTAPPHNQRAPSVHGRATRSLFTDTPWESTNAPASSSRFSVHPITSTTASAGTRSANRSSIPAPTPRSDERWRHNAHLVRGLAACERDRRPGAAHLRPRELVGRNAAACHCA